MVLMKLNGDPFVLGPICRDPFVRNIFVRKEKRLFIDQWSSG